MQDKMLEKIDLEIEAIQRQIIEIGPMRPGTLTRQYHQPAAKEGGYWQLSYTHLRRSYTENVREDELEQVRCEVQEYGRYKDLNAQWLDRAIQRARRQRELTRRKS
jgi:hypothetical protein